METLQTILIFSLIILSISFTAVLIYFLFILKEVKGSVEEAKEILKTGRKLTSSVITPVTAIMGILGGLSKGLKTVRSISDIFGGEDEYEEN